jgi:hypothetical protein
MPKSRLTASQKKPVHVSRPKPKRKSKTGWLEALDALNAQCTKIETLADLLHACDDPESFDVKLASNTGSLIADELRQVKELLETFVKEAR